MELTILLLVIGAYFFPAFIASARGHKNDAAIIATNAFLGWTILGWVICFIWSLTDNTKD